MPYFSIYTPTHDPRHILRAADSLHAQTCQDFEWVVMPNGGAKLPDHSRLPNCKIIEPSDRDSKKIGQLKGE